MERAFYRVVQPLYPENVFPIAMCWNTRYYPRPWTIISELHQYAQSHPSIIATYKEFTIMANFSDKNFKFINRTLTVKEDEAFTTWFQSKDRTADNAIEQAFADGYKVGVSYDEKNNCFIASLVLKLDKGENKSKSLTARSDSWLEAIAMVVYKHHVIFKQGEWISDDNGRVRG